jgi:hypothetical protein
MAVDVEIPVRTKDQARAVLIDIIAVANVSIKCPSVPLYRSTALVP